VFNSNSSEEWIEDFLEKSSNESVDENLQLHEEIADKAQEFEASPNTHGFSPYFENLTSALLFCWIQKHNICKIYLFKFSKF